MDSMPASLLMRLQQPGDQQAWERFVSLYSPLLYFWACRVGLKNDDATDLVQEVFLTLVQKLPSFRIQPDGNFRAWLRTVALNKYRDSLRRRQVVTVQAPAGALEEAPEPQPGQALFEADYHKHIVGRALQIMQADFEAPTWKACWGLIVDDKPAADVAAEVGLSVAAVYAAKARVLRRLRKELDGLLE